MLPKLQVVSLMGTKQSRPLRQLLVVVGILCGSYGLGYYDSLKVLDTTYSKGYETGYETGKSQIDYKALLVSNRALVTSVCKQWWFASPINFDRKPT